MCGGFARWTVIISEMINKKIVLKSSLEKNKPFIITIVNSINNKNYILYLTYTYNDENNYKLITTTILKAITTTIIIIMLIITIIIFCIITTTKTFYKKKKL